MTQTYNISEIDTTVLTIEDLFFQDEVKLARQVLEMDVPDKAKLDAHKTILKGNATILKIVERCCVITDNEGTVIPAKKAPAQVLGQIMQKIEETSKENADPNG